jgi:catechol 2,3-dioxygenase-like lactoylglutathione lyase family enzyme
LRGVAISDPAAQADGAWPSRIAAITLFADDLGPSRAFYRRVFELEPMFEDDSSAVFRVGDILINLLDVSAAPELVDPAKVAPPDAGSRAVYTLPVDDVDEMVARLRDRGVALLNGPMDRRWGPRTASFVDPAGHIWEIAS